MAATECCAHGLDVHWDHLAAQILWPPVKVFIQQEGGRLFCAAK